MLLHMPSRLHWRQLAVGVNVAPGMMLLSSLPLAAPLRLHYIPLLGIPNRCAVLLYSPMRLKRHNRHDEMPLLYILQQRRAIAAQWHALPTIRKSSMYRFDLAAVDPMNFVAAAELLNM